MRITNHRLLGKYQRPEPKRMMRVYTGTDTNTGKTVRFTNASGSPQIISDEEWPKWLPENRFKTRH